RRSSSCILWTIRSGTSSTLSSTASLELACRHGGRLLPTTICGRSRLSSAASRSCLRPCRKNGKLHLAALETFTSVRLTSCRHQNGYDSKNSKGIRSALEEHRETTGWSL